MKVITADELTDDGEYEDILVDMREEGGKFGTYTTLVVSFLSITSTLNLYSIFLELWIFFYLQVYTKVNMFIN